MSSKRETLNPAEGEEFPVSVLAIERREEMLWTATEPLPQEGFPSCIKNIIKIAVTPRQKTTGKGCEKGQHRMAAILAAFLGQAGWPEDEARKLWTETAGDGVEERIFEEWFQELNCPKCETLQRESKGYPELGAADLGICQPEERCVQFDGPVEQAAGLRTEDDMARGRLKHIRTWYRVRIFDWLAGREGEIDLSEAEKDELEGLLREMTEDRMLIYTRARVRGRLRPRFILKEAEGPRKRILSEFL
ncbi:MAG TPA: hypothetical protein VLY86_04440 [Methanothrix sp.]|nr:hypothetical protein [Methanothrix sp.]